MAVKEAFLICALSLPATHHTRPSIIVSHATWIEEEELKEWIKKNNPGAEVFITDKSHPEKMREYGWTKFPATINGKDIWINQKPKSDQKRVLTSA